MVVFVLLLKRIHYLYFFGISTAKYSGEKVNNMYRFTGHTRKQVRKESDVGLILSRWQFYNGLIRTDNQTKDLRNYLEFALEKSILQWNLYKEETF